MDIIKKITALGLMSGSSLEGITASAVITDGIDVYEELRAVNVPYDDDIRERLQKIQGHRPEESEETLAEFKSLEKEITRAHAEVAEDVMEFIGQRADIVGFHGHTVLHLPKERYTRQLGNGQFLANCLQTRVINRFGNADLAAGGQGAPLTPVFYASLVGEYEKPVAVLNIGGITEITWLGDNGEMLAFDIGPGNAPVNDWVSRHGGMHMDYNGKLAITGKIHQKVLNNLLRHKFFAQYPPKSIDRDIFKDKLEHLEGLSLEDGAATATAFIAEAIVYSMALYLPQMPRQVIICGGGAKNPTLVRFIRQRLPNIEVKTTADIGCRADTLEAQAIAYLATRRIYHLPMTFPATTGVAEPTVGGELYEPQALSI